MTGDFHVLAVPGGWAVRSESDPTPSSRYNLQEEAISDARALASQARTDLIVHGVDGNIEFRESYRAEAGEGPIAMKAGPPSSFGTPSA